MEKYANEFGWRLISRENIREVFVEFVKKMDMSYSYKPVLLMAMMDGMDARGSVDIDSIVNYFLEYYQSRRQAGLKVEKENSLFSRESVSASEAKRNILSNPFKRFADMRFMSYSKNLERVEFDRYLFKKLNEEDWTELRKICDEKLAGYYERSF